MSKTTVELPDALLTEAKEYAARERTTLRALIERGLRLVVTERERATGFELQDGSVPGNGLQPEFRDASWEQIRDAIYDYDRP